MAKAAPVIDLRTDFFKDRKVDILAARLGIDLELAQIRLIKLWCWCRDEGLKFVMDGDRPGWVVPDSVVRAFLGSSGPEAILADGCEELALGIRVGDDRIYLCGSEKVARALLANSKKSSKGGKARAANANRSGGRFASKAEFQDSTLAPDSPATPPATTPLAGDRAGTHQPDTSPTPARHQPDTSPTPARIQPGTSPFTSPNQPLTSYQYDLSTRASAEEGSRRVPEQGNHVQRLHWLGWNLGAKKHAELKAKGVDRNARPWSPLPVGEGATWLLERIREMEPQADGGARAEQTIRHVIAVREAEAIRMQSLKYFTPTRMWESASFWRSAEMSVEDAAAAPKATGRDQKPQPEARPSEEL